MAIIIGPVKPWVLAAFKEIQSKFPCSSVYGNPSTGFPDHLAGLALDFMVMTDKAKGDAIASYAIANYQRLGIGYVIWYQRIWYPSRNAWTPMPDRGSVNLNHMNHVHLNFNATPPKGGPVVNTASAAQTTSTSANPLDALSGIGNALSWITNPHNQGRVGLFLLGAVFLLVSVGRAMNASQVVKPVAKVIQNGS